MNKLILIVPAFLLMFCFSMSVALAVDSTTPVDTLKADDVFIKLISSQADLMYGTSIFEVYNPTKVDALLSFGYSKVNGDIVKNEYYIQVQESYFTDIYGKPYNVTYDCCLDKPTIPPIDLKDCKDIGKCEKEQIDIEGKQENFRAVWKESKVIPSGYKGEVKMISYFSKPNYRNDSVNIDWIPTLTVYDYTAKPYSLTQTKWAWWNNSWSNRMNITVNKSLITENITNFPLYIKLNATTFNYSKANTTGNDIRFTDDSNNLLPYEIESWNNIDNNSYVWVGADVSTSADTVIMMYYNNPSAPDGQNKSGIWTSNYLGVYHFNNANLSVMDSSIYNQHANFTAGNNNYTYIYSSLVGAGIKFINTSATYGSKYTNPFIGLNGTFNSSLYVTYSASKVPYNNYQSEIVSIAPSSATYVNSIAQAYVYGGWNGNQTWTFLFTNNTYAWLGNNTNGADAINKYSQAVSTYNGSRAMYYWNGTAYNSASLTGWMSAPATTRLTIGSIYKDSSLSYQYAGVIDEVRVMNATMSPAYIKASYHAEQEQLLSFSSEDSADQTPPSWANNSSSISQALSIFNITWTDASGVSSVYIEGNWSGSPQNYSMFNIAGDIWSYNATNPVGIWYWKSYANDTYNNWNATPSWDASVHGDCVFGNITTNTTAFPIWFNITSNKSYMVLLEFDGNNYTTSNYSSTYYKSFNSIGSVGIIYYRWLCNNTFNEWQNTTTYNFTTGVSGGGTGSSNFIIIDKYGRVSSVTNNPSGNNLNILDYFIILISRLIGR